MNFNICFGNFAGPTQSVQAQILRSMLAGDMVMYVCRSLEELGHRVTINRSYVDKDAINLFLERFYGDPDQPAALRRNGYKWGLITPEQLLTDGLYNPFEFGEAKARQVFQEFAGAARAADFVWYLMEEAGPVCRSVNPNSHFLPFGFVEKFGQLGDPASRRYVTDFNITGLPTERRLSILESLKALGFRVSSCHAEPDYIRLSMMESARMTLSVQKSLKHQIFSPGRVPHAIMNRVPILVEYDGPPSYLAKYCAVAPPDDFVAACTEFAKRQDLPQLAQRFYDRFAAEMPMRPIMERVLEASLSAPARG